MSSRLEWFDGIRGVIFDAVHTLIVPTVPVHETYVAEARRQGVELETATIRDRFRRHFRDDEALERSGALTTDEERERERWRRIVRAVLPELPDPDEGFDRLWNDFGLPGSWRCPEDVAPTLDAIRARSLPIGMASNFDTRLRTVVAGLAELSGRIDKLVISSEIGHRKPGPGFYRGAFETMGLSAETILWIGDDPENDVAGPIRAGARALLLDRADRHANFTPAPRIRRLTKLIGDGTSA